jgi:hypothetical protein
MNDDGQQPRHAPVDREQAFQYWASLPVDGRSYKAVADQFEISPRTVERYAREGRWKQRLRRIDAEAAARADEELGRKRAQQLADFHQLIEASCIAYARQLANGQVKITAAEFVGLIRAHLLLQGEPARIELTGTSDEWAALRDRILTALAGFPEARLALADALDEDDEDDLRDHDDHHDHHDDREVG